MTREEILNKIEDNLTKLEKGKINAYNASTMLNYLKTLLKEIDNDPLPDITPNNKLICS